MGVAPVPTIQKAQKTRRPARRTFMRALPHLVPCIVYFLYLIAGSFVFIALERENLKELMMKHETEMNKMKTKIEDAIINESNGIYNGTNNWRDLLNDYTRLVTRPELKLGRHKNLQEGGSLTFSGSMLFCLITITTIGYGDIVPVTSLGRIFVTAYAAFGIPLNVIFLADVGYLFAKVIVKFIRAIKLWKLRRRRAREAAKSPTPAGTAKQLSRLRRRKKYAKRGRKFKHIHKDRPKAMHAKGGLSASRGMSVHARSVLRSTADKTEEDTSFTNNSTHTNTLTNGGQNLYEETSYPISLQRANTLAAPRSHRAHKNKSGGLSASRNMSVHAKSLRRRVTDDDELRHYARRPRERRGGQGMKRHHRHQNNHGGISASRNMSVHARSIMRHLPEDIDSEETTSNEEPIKTVSEGIESITHEILAHEIALSMPNSKSDANLVGNEHLSPLDSIDNNEDTISDIGDQALSMASETTDKSSVGGDDESVDTEVPIILVLFILLSYIGLGAVMMMYIEGWHYGESLYFTIITLTTIGYGDIAPNNHYSDEYFFTCIIYTIFGLAVMSTCIALVQAKVLRVIDKITRKIRRHAEL